MKKSLRGMFMGKFRYDIGISNKYLFGCELEFTGVYISELSKLFRSTSLPVRFALNHKSRGYTKYDEWYLDIDSTVTKRDNGEYLGGELSSRILTDKKNTWIELKDICDVLKSVNATPNENCSNHITVNLSSITDERYFFEVLSKLIVLYESDIRLFYMGDDYLIRQTSIDEARTLGNHLLRYINTVDFADSDYYYKFRNNGYTLFTRRDVINLQKYSNQKLIEIRYPNGTIKAKTIQNNINFSLKLIDAIDKKLFDPQELTSKISENKDELQMQLLFDETDYHNFENLVKTISTSSEDIDDFMSQYEHVLTNKPKLL